MKTRIFSITLVTALVLISCKNDVEKDSNNVTTKAEEETQMSSENIAMMETTFGVRGNCGMCKSTIEEAANSVEGVSMANWDKDKKKIDVKFDKSKTDMMAIHKAIAASGYDTEEVEANEEAYSKLPECCQYDHSMIMNQIGEMMSEKMEEHDH